MSSQSRSDDIKYMSRAFELALRGSGHVSPNPMVGCVIVNNGQIVGEGWHERYGKAHAEVNAVNAVKSSESLVGATVYVTLEPCSHHGKTPPCADLLQSIPIKRVVIAQVDPNPVVSGKGLEKLREGNLEVEILQDKHRLYINRRFTTFHSLKRPYIILKWAQTKDGFIARSDFDSKWISNKFSRKLVHKWRTEESAIMVGANTIIHDDPMLTARDWSGKNPIRVVIDPNARLQSDHNVFDGKEPTIVYNYLKNKKDGMIDYVKIGKEKFLANLFADLWNRNILSVLVEGGGFLHNSLISENLWDEARVFTGVEHFGNGIKAPIINRGADSKETLFGDILLHYNN